MMTNMILFAVDFRLLKPRFSKLNLFRFELTKLIKKLIYYERIFTRSFLISLPLSLLCAFISGYARHETSETLSRCASSVIVKHRISYRYGE